jgi:hypothetical protein
VCFASFLSVGFTTLIINQPENKLAKCTYDEEGFFDKKKKIQVYYGSEERKHAAIKKLYKNQWEWIFIE